MLVEAFLLGMVAGFALGGVVIQRGSSARLLLAGLALVASGSLGFVLGADLAVFAVSCLVVGLGSGCLWLGIAFATLVAWPGQQRPCMSRAVRSPFAAYLALVLGRSSAAAMRRADRTPPERPAPAVACAGHAPRPVRIGLPRSRLYPRVPYANFQIR
jgi:hypothetical protein